ncbi:MAG: hypothetical protein Q4A17_00680 [Thermoguttaceae bacterium]|nr:hypothetical protein [Thermoguttaceae bacterium]
MLAILEGIASVWAGDRFPEGGMADGNFVPCTVLIYDQGQWLPTEKKNAVDPTKYTFVIIHGAHCCLKKEYISRLAEALAKERPDANILAMDWSAWSAVGAPEITEWIGNITFKLFGRKTNNPATLTDIFAEIIKKAIPVEQARHIPETADRLTWKLFGQTGKVRVFTTLDPNTKTKIRSKMRALGLDPQKTHLIGHSHGAHVAGLVGMTLQKNETGQLDRISALDPSTSLVHDYPENFMGTGWDKTSARLVAVFRTTYFFSSDKEATDDSLFFDWRDPNHPYNHPPESSMKIAGWLWDVIMAEFQNHKNVFDRFAEMIQKTDYLEESL